MAAAARVIKNTDDTVHPTLQSISHCVCLVNWIISGGDNDSQATLVHKLLLHPKVDPYLGSFWSLHLETDPRSKSL